MKLQTDHHFLLFEMIKVDICHDSRILLADFIL